MSRTILVLGGYGTTGSRIAELLLSETDANVVIAGRRLAEAKTLAERLGKRAKPERARAVLADVDDFALLTHAFQGTDLVIVASSTSAQVDTVAQAALEAGADYLDVQYSSAKVRYLESIAGEIAERGRCFITDGGFHPGLPAALVRFAAGFMDRIQRAHVGSVIQLDWKGLALSRGTTMEFVAELKSYRPAWFKQGTWMESWRERRRFAFGAPFGTRAASPMFLEELRSLPDLFPSLAETGFYVGGFNWFVDNVVLPVGWLVMRRGRGGARAIRVVGAVMKWGLREFSKPPFGTVLLLEASGWKKGRMVSLRGSVRHDDGYALTAIPVVACVLQYLDGSVRKPGLFYQALAVDPRRFLTDIERLGATVEYELDVET
jgi:NAD(P)-dependent dehydrogenase (short-subunit alcohol dehydrogenase family)